MAALYLLEKLSEVVGSPKVEDQMKFVFNESHNAEESFIELMREQCSTVRLTLTKNRRLVAELEVLAQRGEGARPLELMKEMVRRDATTLGAMEQLLAAAHVGSRVKSGYAAEMEATD